jgi:hypothetical protein
MRILLDDVVIGIMRADWAEATANAIRNGEPSFAGPPAPVAPSPDRSPSADPGDPATWLETCLAMGLPKEDTQGREAAVAMIERLPPAERGPWQRKLAATLW